MAWPRAGRVLAVKRGEVARDEVSADPVRPSFRRLAKAAGSLGNHGRRLPGDQFAERSGELDLATGALGQVRPQLDKWSRVSPFGQDGHQLPKGVEHRQDGRVAGPSDLSESGAHPLADHDVVLQKQCALPAQLGAIEDAVPGPVEECILRSGAGTGVLGR